MLGPGFADASENITCLRFSFFSFAIIMRTDFGWSGLLAVLVCLGVQSTAWVPLRSEELLPLSADMSASYGLVGASDLRVGGIAPVALDDVVLLPMAMSAAENQHSATVAKPAYVVLAAELANWDADSEPDGWRCQVQTRDQFDGPVRPLSSYATFELRLRVPRRDRNGFADIRMESVRWSLRLEVDATGIATVKLPLRTRLPGSSAGMGGPSRLAGSQKSMFSREERGSERFRESKTFAGNGWVNSVAEPRPAFGIMSVRVSIPGIGILAADDPVLADEPLLVDSNWPQR